MFKIEVGEVVEIIGNINNHQFYIGEPVIIKEIERSYAECVGLVSRKRRWLVVFSDMRKIDWT